MRKTFDVLQDGHPVQCTMQPPEKGELKVEATIEVPAKGSTKVTLRAQSQGELWSRTEQLSFRRAQVPRRLWVLAMGVQDYADPQLKLNAPSRDVGDLVAALKSQAPSPFAEVDVEPLRDGEVTLDRIRKWRNEKLSQSGPADTFIVFLAGHGIRNERGYVFLTREATPKDPSKGIEREDLEAVLADKRIKAERRILLLDTCCAGADPETDERGVGRPAYDAQEAKALSSGKGVCVLAATASQAAAMETKGNGVFTRAVCDGLHGAADGSKDGVKDGFVSIEELIKFTQAQVKQATGGKQEPTGSLQGTDFPLARVPDTRPPKEPSK